ncbi:MAG: type II toxin-antitoxin system PemK/MazF family toxin [Clostridiales bacterium]|nr:type II toxin-antitoxin system PemK/MazF family toxin [Clostridiales bacterium]
MRVYRGDIYIANLDGVVGSEQGGERPVLVIQNDTGNRFSSTTIIAPITCKTKGKEYLPTHVPIRSLGLSKDSVVLLEQIRVVDRKRFKGQKLCSLDEKYMADIEKAIAVSLDLECAAEQVSQHNF